jgi:hypothetical protein
MQRIIFSILFLFAGLLANAQNLLIGVGAGGNLSRFKFTENLETAFPDSKFKSGLNGGLRVGYNFTPYFGVLSGFEYAQKGGVYSTNNFRYVYPDGSDLVGYSEWEESHRFVSIPLLARWQSGGEDGGFLLTAGFTFNIGLNGSIKQRFESPQLSAPLTLQDDDISFGSSARDWYRPMQTGFVFAPGFMFPMGERSRLTVNLGMDFGLSDSFNEKWKSFTNIIGEQINRTLFLSVGYEYHFEGGGEVF